MVKIIELVIVAVLLAFSFFAGVKYSESVKEHAGWLFEVKAEEEEVELPDLSGEGAVEINSSSDLLDKNSAEAGSVEAEDSESISEEPIKQ